MVKQQRRSEMTPEQQKALDATVASLTRHVSTDFVNRRQRRGIIKLQDEWGQTRKFYDHQVVAAQRLLLKQHKTYFYARKAALVYLHDMGLGTLRPARRPHTL